MTRVLKIFDNEVVDTREAVRKGNGDHRVSTHEETALFAEVQNGKVVGYHADTAKGRAEGLYVRMVDDPASNIDARRLPPGCLYCVPSGEPGGWICFRVPCGALDH